MDHNFDFEHNHGTPIVYVRPVLVSDLPEEFQALSQDVKTVYAVHDVEGQRLALVRDRKLAFVLARQHDFEPVNVH